MSKDARFGSWEETDQEPSSEMPVVDLDLEDVEEHTAAPQEEFSLLERSKNEELEKLQGMKVSRGVTVTLTSVMTLLLTRTCVCPSVQPVKYGVLFSGG